MRHRLRVWRAWLDGQPIQPTRMHLPAIDTDGDRCWVEVLYAPTPEEVQIMCSNSDTHRAAYHCIAMTKAREATEAGTEYAVGWE